MMSKEDERLLWTRKPSAYPIVLKGEGLGGVRCECFSLREEKGEVIFGVESLSMYMKNVTTQNQQIHFDVKCKAPSLSPFLELATGRRERFVQTIHATLFSASNHIVRVTVLCIVYSRISSPGINDAQLSDF